MMTLLPYQFYVADMGATIPSHQFRRIKIIDLQISNFEEHGVELAAVDLLSSRNPNTKQKRRQLVMEKWVIQSLIM